MIEPWLWSEADINSLIANAVQESLTLDYKRCDALQKTDGKRREVSKDVSAFANSAGGVIVYGIEEDKHLPTGIDVGFDPKEISKEWIEQVINSTIERRIDGVLIKEVALSGPKSGKVIYVVSIPQSRRAPHMAADNRYYKRFNFESVPMEDYEVRDVSRRLETPDLHIFFRMDRGNGVLEHQDEKNYRTVQAQAIVGNKSPAASVFALLRYCIDSRLGQRQDNVIHTSTGDIDVCSQVIEWRGGLRLPIFESSSFKLGHFDISLPKTTGPFYLFWDAQAPMMKRKSGIVTVEAVKGVLTFTHQDIDWTFLNEVFHQV